MEGWLLNTVRIMYNENEASIKINGLLNEWFIIEQILRQSYVPFVL